MPRNSDMHARDETRTSYCITILSSDGYQKNKKMLSSDESFLRSWAGNHELLATSQDRDLQWRLGQNDEHISQAGRAPREALRP